MTFEACPYQYDCSWCIEYGHACIGVVAGWIQYARTLARLIFQHKRFRHGTKWKVRNNESDDINAFAWCLSQARKIVQQTLLIEKDGWMDGCCVLRATSQIQFVRKIWQNCQKVYPPRRTERKIHSFLLHPYNFNFCWISLLCAVRWSVCVCVRIPSPNINFHSTPQRFNQRWTLWMDVIDLHDVKFVSHAIE